MVLFDQRHFSSSARMRSSNESDDFWLFNAFSLFGECSGDTRRQSADSFLVSTEFVSEEMDSLLMRAAACLELSGDVRLLSGLMIVEFASGLLPAVVTGAVELLASFGFSSHLIESGISRFVVGAAFWLLSWLNSVGLLASAFVRLNSSFSLVSGCCSEGFGSILFETVDSLLADLLANSGSGRSNGSWILSRSIELRCRCLRSFTLKLFESLAAFA